MSVNQTLWILLGQIQAHFLPYGLFHPGVCCFAFMLLAGVHDLEVKLLPVGTFKGSNKKQAGSRFFFFFSKKKSAKQKLPQSSTGIYYKPI